MTLNKLLQDYLDYLEIEKNRSTKTRENYNRYINRFLSWLAEDIHKAIDKLEPRHIDNETVRRYRLWLNRIETLKGDTIKKNTQAYHIIALRNFLKYLAKRDISVISADKIELPKIPTREIDLIGQGDLERLLNSPDLNTLGGLRDKAIIETLFSTGLRVSELCKLNRDSIDLKRGEFSVTGKGNKTRVVFLSDQAKKAIEHYLDKRPDVEEALFTRIAKTDKPQTLSRLTSRSIERIIKHYALKAGIVKRVVPHTLRHVFATDLLQSGADLRSVQSLLGHSSITTTQIYTHITDKELHEIHRAFHAKRLKR